MNDDLKKKRSWYYFSGSSFSTLAAISATSCFWFSLMLSPPCRPAIIGAGRPSPADAPWGVSAISSEEGHPGFQPGQRRNL